MFRTGIHAGRTSLVYAPNCFAIEIKNPRLTVQCLEQMMNDYRIIGCLIPLGKFQIISGEQFLNLMVLDEEEGFVADCGLPNQIHG